MVTPDARRRLLLLGALGTAIGAGMGLTLDFRERLPKSAQRVDQDVTAPDISGAAWRLVRFTGGDGRTLQPDDRTQYIVELRADGRATVRIGIHRGSGGWKVGGRNEIEMGPLALPQVAGSADSLVGRFARDWTSLHRYEIRDGHLILSLANNAGHYDFEPVPRTAAAGVTCGAHDAGFGAASKISTEMTLGQITELLGEPEADRGSGLHVLEWSCSDETRIHVSVARVDNDAKPVAVNISR